MPPLPSDQPSSTRHPSFQQLADGAPVMIWMSGLDMGCFYFNHAWLDFRGRTLEEESGNGWAEGVHPLDLQRCVNHYVSCFERRVAFAMTYRLKDRHGDYLWILDRGAPHYLADGTFLGFFGGCAEIERQTPLVRATQLRASLAEMSEFARELASLEAAGASDRDLHHAAKQLAQLASDMLALDETPRGACLP
jgi:PAS domain S-box-containing protein